MNLNATVLLLKRFSIGTLLFLTVALFFTMWATPIFVIISDTQNKNSIKPTMSVKNGEFVQSFKATCLLTLHKQNVEISCENSQQ